MLAIACSDASDGRLALAGGDLSSGQMAGDGQGPAPDRLSPQASEASTNDDGLVDVNASSRGPDAELAHDLVTDEGVASGPTGNDLHTEDVLNTDVEEAETSLMSDVEVGMSDLSVSDASSPGDAVAGLDVPELLHDALSDSSVAVDEGGSGDADAEAQTQETITDAADAQGTQDPQPLWLLSVDNVTHQLLKIDVSTAETVVVCSLDTTVGYPSLTFSRSNGLFGSRSGTSLDTIDPCTCAITPVGSYGVFSGLFGITSDQGFNLYGVATTQDQLVSVATESGWATGVGPLGTNFTSSGATWSDTTGALFAINAANNGLYEVNPNTGEATLTAILTKNFGTVGIELHPRNGVVYACTDDHVLLRVNTNTGAVSEVGVMGHAGACTNLAAPWFEVDCIDDL